MRIAILFILLLPIAFAQDLTSMSSDDIAGLGDEERKAITAEKLVVCFQSIECASNLGDLSGYPNALSALNQHYKIDIQSFGQGANIQNGRLHATFGVQDSVTLSGTHYQDGQLTVTKQGEFVFTPKIDVKNEVINIPKADTVTIDTQPPKNVLDRVRNLKVNYNGKSVRGKLTIRNGEMVLRVGDEAVVNGYYFQHQRSEVSILNKDSKVPAAGNYFQFTENGFRMITMQGSAIRVEPHPDYDTPGHFLLLKRTPGVPTSDQERWRIDDKSFMQLAVRNGEGLEVVSRVKEGKAPLIKHIKGSGDFRIQSGRGLEIGNKGERLYVRRPDPLGSRIKDFTRGGAFKFVSGDDSVISMTSNRFGYYRKGQLVVSNVDDVRLTDDLAFNQITGVAMLKKLHPEFIYKLKGPDGYKDITPHMAQTFAEWMEDKQGMHEVNKKIEFNLIANAAAVHTTSSFVGLKMVSQSLKLGEPLVDLDTRRNKGIRDFTTLGLIDHEFVHLIVTADKLKHNDGFSVDQVLQVRAKELASDKDFLTILKEIDPINADEIIAKIATGDPESLNTVSEIEIELQESREFQKLKRYRKIVRRTGLPPYAYHYKPPVVVSGDLSVVGTVYSEGFPETWATYGELSILEARKNPEISQEWYEIVMRSKAPASYKEREEKRYRKIVGEVYWDSCNPPGCVCIKFPAVCEVEK